MRTKTPPPAACDEHPEIVRIKALIAEAEAAPVLICPGDTLEDAEARIEAHKLHTELWEDVKP